MGGTEGEVGEVRQLRIVIPGDLPFSALRLSRCEDGSVEFEVEVIERVCEASGLDPAVMFDSREENVCGLIIWWYVSGRRAGEPADPVAEDLIAEAEAEDAVGQGLSLAPGRA